MSECTLATLENVAITAAVGTTPEIQIEGFTQGRVFVPAGSGLTGLTMYAAAKSAKQSTGGTTPVVPTFLVAFDKAAVPAAIVQTVAAGGSYPLHADLFCAAAIKMVGNTTGNVDVSLK